MKVKLGIKNSEHWKRFAANEYVQKLVEHVASAYSLPAVCSTPTLNVFAQAASSLGSRN